MELTDRSYMFVLQIETTMAKGEDTRQMIIERSAPIFNTKGIAATAMSDIMEATKLAKGSLYVHFSDKDDLAITVVDYNLEQLGKKVMAAVNRHTHARDRLFAYLDAFLDPMRPLVKGGCPMMNFGTEADDTNEKVRKKVQGGVELGEQIIINIIRQGIKDGVFRTDWNYKEFATMMFAMIEGGIVICRIAGNNNKMKVINRNLKKMIEAQLS